MTAPISLIPMVPLAVRLPLLTLLVLACGTPVVYAQTPPPQPPVVPNAPQQNNPNQDRLLTPAPPSLKPLPQEQPPPVLPNPTPEPPPGQSSEVLSLRRVEVTGSTILKPEQISAVTRPVEGRTLTRAELINSTIIPLTKLYLDQGYLTSRAELAAIEDGVVKIRIIEGTIARVEVEGTQRLNPSYVRDRVQLGISTPLNTPKLEDQLRLLRTNPLFSNVEATLRRGESASTSDLIVRVTEAPPLATSLSIDNYSPPSVGSERGSASLLYRNPTGLGDQASVAYSVSTGASNIYDFNYQVPLNPMEGTLALRIAPNNTKITESPFNAFGIRGTSDLYEISYRQPIFRTFSEEFALSFGFAYQRGQTFILNDQPFPFAQGADANGVSSTSVFKFGQDYLRRDELGAWSLRSQFSLGTGLFGATVNPDPIPDGRFFSWFGQFSRLQLLGSGNSLIFQGELQLSADPLQSAQQYILGGAQSVRGYRQNIRQGDNGYRLSVEGRFPVVKNDSGLPVFQLAPFVEGGGVWNVDNHPNQPQDNRFLASAGLGLLWEPQPGLNVRLDYGIPFVSLPDGGNNLQDSGLYFSINYRP
jgi:hemolysin activation/secretion protein